MNELALFAGAGGGILGGHLLGWRTVCAVEWKPYAASVLAARQNDGILAPFPIWDDVCTFDGRPWRGLVDVVSGGFPCQDISAAGAGAGIEGERSGLWREMARIIGEVRPCYVWVENSPLLVGRGLAVVLGDLAQMGFDAQWCRVSASELRAPHLRDRIWILANARGGRRGEPRQRQMEQPRGAQTIRTGDHVADAKGERWPETREFRLIESAQWSASSCQSISYVANAKLRGLSGRWRAEITCQERALACGVSSDERKSCDGQARPVLAHSHGLNEQRIIAARIDSQVRPDTGERPVGSCGDGFGRWPAEPNVGRVAHGVAARLDRTEAIGNGQVPRVVAAAFNQLKSGWG